MNKNCPLSTVSFFILSGRCTHEISKLSLWHASVDAGSLSHTPYLLIEELQALVASERERSGLSLCMVIGFPIPNGQP